MKKLTPGLLAQFAVLIAMEVILSRFLSINAWNLKIGFAFVPIAVAGMLFGALPAGVIAAIADLIGATLFPSGPFFPGFTLTAFLGGVVYGALLHRERTPWRIAAAVCIRELALSFVLNTLWISILYGSDFFWLLIFGGRIIQCAAMIPVQFVIITLLSGTLSRIKAHSKA